MPVNGNIYISGVQNWNKFQLFDASCTGSEINCFNANGYFYNLISGNTYKLRVFRKTSDISKSYRSFSIQAFETATNDTCATAEQILPISTLNSTSIDFEMRKATSNNEVGCDTTTSDDYHDLWYYFQMPVNGNIYISGFQNWNKFQLLDASCTGSEIYCFNTNGYFHNLISGNTYKLRVFRKTSDTAKNYRSFTIQAFETATNDTCATAEQIPAIPTLNSTSIDFEMRKATSNNEVGCDTTTSDDYHDLWYYFQMPVNGNIYISGFQNWNKFQLLDASCTGSEIDCFNGNGYFYSLVSGNTYRLRVFRKTLDAAKNYRSFTIKAIETATNDLCINAINLTVGVFDEFKETKTLFGASPSGSSLPPPNCGANDTDNDVWFTVQVPSSGKLTIETSQAIGSTLNDTIIQIFENSCGSFTEITCDDNSGEANFSKASVSGRIPTETLYVRLVENGNNIADYYNIFAYDNDCTSRTIWNGTSWSNLAPTSNSIAIFDGNYTASTTGLDMCMCKINDNATITIEGGKYFNLTNDLINEGHLIVNNQASFVQTDENSTIIGSGSFTTKIETNSLPDSRYTYFSSPVQNEQISVFNSWAEMSKIYKFDSLTQNWSLTNSFNMMTPGKGYIVRPPNPVVFNTPSTGTATSFIGETSFIGKFNNGDITHNLTYNTGGFDDDNELLGNPYPSAIVTATLFTDNPRANAFYFWTHDNPENAGVWIDDYAVYNSLGYTSGNSSTPAPTYIASGQGFFVVGSTDDFINPLTLTFKNSQRVKDQNNQFLRPVDNNLDKIWLNLSNINSGINSQILIGFNSICTSGFDAQYDATRFNSGSILSFYSTGIGVDTEKLAIQTRGLLTSQDEIIPIGFEISDTAVSSLIISIDHFENLANTDVFLNDTQLNIIHNLKLSDYNFTQSQLGNINTRFELIFSRNTLNTQDNILDIDNLIVTNISENKIKIKAKSSSVISKFKAFDVLGKLIINLKPNKSNFIINTPSIKQGSLLFIKAQLENGKILNTKFIKY